MSVYFMGEFASCQRPYRRKAARSATDAVKTCCGDRKKDDKAMTVKQ